MPGLGTGALYHRVAFDQRAAAADGYGNAEGAFVEQFRRWAAFLYAGGGETVTAARLEGRGVLKVRLRSDSRSRAIAADWRMRDVFTGTVYAIRDVDAAADRAWVYLMVESGVAA